MTALRRVAAIAAGLWIAPNAWAHGEQLIGIYIGIVFVLPAALFLFIPWHRLLARLACVAVLAALTFVLWTYLLPHLEGRELSAATQWIVSLAPVICTLALAIALRLGRRRSAP